MNKAERPSSLSLAEAADKHALYEESVQCVEAEIDMVDDTFFALRGYHAQLLREDFAGTAATSCEWLKRRDSNIAVAVDLDTEVLEYGQQRALNQYGIELAERLAFLHANVLDAECEPAQILLAMNFSYQIFKDRTDLLTYFKSCFQQLSDDGVLFLDAYGGTEACTVCKETTEHDAFSYTWDQASYNPIDGTMQCYIDFDFPDGSQLKHAFAYHWRMWTLPEIRDLLAAAGFKNTTVYWEQTDPGETEGNGVYKAVANAEQEPSWIVYLSAEKQ